MFLKYVIFSWMQELQLEVKREIEEDLHQERDMMKLLMILIIMLMNVRDAEVVPDPDPAALVSFTLLIFPFCL